MMKALIIKENEKTMSRFIQTSKCFNEFTQNIGTKIEEKSNQSKYIVKIKRMQNHL